MIFKASEHCWFSKFAMTPCDGPADRCHLIPKQRIKREIGKHGATADQVRAAVWHPSVWVPGCRKHHANFDNRALRIERSDVPPETEVYAQIMGLGWSLEADYGSMD